MVKRKIKQTKNSSEDMTQVKNLLILLGIVVVICVGLYFFTDSMIKKEKELENEIKDVEIDYDIASVGTMFNRPENEYFVLLYSTKNEGSDYTSILNTYRSSDNYTKTYFVDLDKKINSHVLKDTLNKKPTNSEEVSVKGATLFKIKNGKVEKCYSTLETIKDILK